MLRAAASEAPPLADLIEQQSTELYSVEDDTVKDYVNSLSVDHHLVSAPRPTLISTSILGIESRQENPHEGRHRDPFLATVREKTNTTILSYKDAAAYGVYGFIAKEFASQEFVHGPGYVGTYSSSLNAAGVDYVGTSGLSRGSRAAVEYNLGLRSRVIDYDYDPALLDLAVELMVQSLPDFTKVEPTFLGDVVYAADGATGCGFECCNSKEKAVREHFEQIHRYTQEYRELSPPLFRYMHKEHEVLPEKKITSQQIRAIVFPPMHFYCLQKCHTQVLDNALKKACHPWIAYGISLIRGGMHSIAMQLKSKRILFKGDCTKFDTSVRSVALEAIKRVRQRVSHPSSHDALEFIYATLSNKSVVLPNSEVIMDGAQASGQACTTSDNCIWHCIVLYAMCILRLRSLGCPVTLANCHSLLIAKIYADDHVASTNDAVLSEFSFRQKVYASFGLTLKEEDDLVTQDISLLTFLGGTFHMTEHQQYVYRYHDQSAIPNLHIALEGQTPAEVLQTLTSYAELFAADEQNFDVIFRSYDIINRTYRVGAPALPASKSFIAKQLCFEALPHKE